MPFSAVMTATIVLSASMTMFLGLWADLPFAIAPGMGLRNDDPVGTAVDDQAEGQYWVINGLHHNDGCCFDYGNAETDSRDDGNGTMETKDAENNGYAFMKTSCMHCADPVCMIGCPTGAIGRDAGSGNILINDETCIGCSTCATFRGLAGIDRDVTFVGIDDSQPMLDRASVA